MTERENRSIFSLFQGNEFSRYFPFPESGIYILSYIYKRCAFPDGQEKKVVVRKLTHDDILPSCLDKGAKSKIKERVIHMQKEELIFELEEAAVNLKLITHVFMAINIAMCDGNVTLDDETLRYPCDELQKISDEINTLVEKFFAENEV